MVPRASTVIAFAFVAYYDLVVTCDDGLLWIVKMVYCELWRWFIMPVTYNYVCDDGFLWIVIVYCELRGVRYTWQISKKRGVGRFAECNTRQREDLPSVKAKHSAKRPFSVILGTFFAEYFGFAECNLMDTRQSDHKIWSLSKCLPSVLGVTLGKVSKLCRLLWPWHETLPSVLGLTLGKVEKLCWVFFHRALSKSAVTVPSR